MDPYALLDMMCKALDDRAKDVEEYEDWYEGDHPVPPPPSNTYAATDIEARRAFENLSRLAVTNFLPPIVDATASKLRVEGFRFSSAPTSSDAEAWAIWQRNFLDADQALVHVGALAVGQATAIVWTGADGLAEITCEDPEQTIVLYAAGSRRKRLAGLKRWCDDDEHLLATLYLADAIYKFRSVQPVDKMRPNEDPKVAWKPREVPGEAWPLPNPLGRVPMVEARVNASLKPERFGGGEPEFEKQINLQRQINATTLAMLTTMEHQAFRQRWVVGWEAPTNPDGTPDRYALLKAAAGKLWTFDDPDVKVGEFAQADLRPFLEVNLATVKAMAATSATPPYAFLIGDMVNVAADSLARIEGAHTAKVRAHAATFSEFWQEVLSLGLQVEGNPKWTDTATSVVWGDIEQRTATEQIGVAQALKNLGAPSEAVFAALPDVDQATAARWAREARAAQLVANAAAPIPPVAR